MEGDVEKAVSLLKDVRHKCEDVTSHINNLVTKAENGDLNTSKGISFLEVKYQLLLSYLTNLTYVMLKKTHGQAIQGDESIERLVEIRTVLEKMRPIDQKLKYQVDKVISIAATGGQDSNDPMRFKANPDSLESKIESGGSESGSDVEEDEEEKSSKVYRPPKMAAVHYDGDENQSSKREKQIENLRKRALNSDILQDLKDQYYDGPEEIRESRDLHRMKADRKTKEKTRYEEEHFVRLNTSKKDLHSQQKVGTISSLNSLTHFNSISALDMEDGKLADFPAKRRKVEKSKNKKGKKGFKKKRRR
ncbi:neuroguidin-like [Mercenaria mercenaria]|uniref:neuroguidin-like n=1 Tax=Mercenaria mercenaria TaxID=6596 RepID=UPI00234FA8D5|nr:neuroguidin-like [Mercenaria mercenaria]